MGTAPSRAVTNERGALLNRTTVAAESDYEDSDYEDDDGDDEQKRTRSELDQGDEQVSGCILRFENTKLKPLQDGQAPEKDFYDPDRVMVWACPDAIASFRPRKLVCWPTQWCPRVKVVRVQEKP